MIFPTSESYINGLKKLAGGKPQSIIIATYNIYAGVLHDGNDAHQWGGKYENEVHHLFDKIQNVPDVKILVGIPPLILCKEKCEDCIAHYYKWIVRLNQHKEKWPMFKWRYTERFHLKCCIFYYKGGFIGVGGGRNMSSSDWIDVSFILNNEQAGVIKEIFDNSWKTAKEVNMDNLEGTITAQL